MRPEARCRGRRGLHTDVTAVLQGDVSLSPLVARVVGRRAFRPPERPGQLTDAPCRISGGRRRVCADASSGMQGMGRRGVRAWERRNGVRHRRAMPQLWWSSPGVRCRHQCAFTTAVLGEGFLGGGKGETSGANWCSTGEEGEATPRRRPPGARSTVFFLFCVELSRGLSFERKTNFWRFL